MTRSAALVAAASAALAFAVSSPPGQADNPRLIATVGTNDGFDIGLADANGAPVTRIPPGTYDIVVRDLSRAHNFHLASDDDPTVDFRTELDFVGEMTFTVTLKDDVRYTYACEPHWQTMNGSFFVTSQPEPPPPPPPPPTLRAGVTAAGRAFIGPRRVRAGRYRIVVADRSRRANFHLRGRGLNRRTGMRFTGAATWSVRLVAGRYRFGSDPKPLAGTLSVRRSP
ncbi:MAG: cupredoxin domain-containing protein [Gaiellaceae bacterium]